MLIRKIGKAGGQPSHKSYSSERARTEAIFASIGAGVITTDANGRIDRVNQRAIDLLGYSRKELIGTWFPQIVVAKDNNGDIIDALDRPIAQAFLLGHSISAKTNYQTKNGDLLPVSITVSPIIVDGEPVGGVEVFDDITRELEIDKMKSDFISLASHQLRTPLTAIRIYSEMLVDGHLGDLNKKQIGSLDTVLKSVKRMNKLISALLDVSKIETGRLNLKNTQIDLSDIMRGTVKSLKLEARAKKIKVNMTIDGTDFKIETDALLVGEVLSNLISNAIKYTPTKGKIDVSLSEHKLTYLCCVSDNGMGIPADFQNKIFTKFSRADNAQKADTTGTGLGLYLVKEIAKILGGELWFQSKENKGTKFYFSLPKQIS